MRRFSSHIVLLFIFATPLLALAATTPSPAQTPAGATAFCPQIKSTLQLGVSGAEVASLQRYLIYDGYMTAGSISGMYNAQTQNAVKRWQLEHHVITKDDDEATGAGLVGPKTRAAMLKACGMNDGSWATNGPPSAQRPPPPPPAPKITIASSSATSTFSMIGKCSSIARPTASCVAWKGVMGKNGCVAAWVCTKTASSTTATTTSNKPPYITNIAGPTSVHTGSSTSWTVNAIDPEGGVLGYNFQWVDLAAPVAPPASQTFASSSVATHTFAGAGIFSLSATVRDDAGNTAGTALQISVGSDAGDTSTGSTPGNPSPSPTPSTGTACTYRNASYSHGTVLKLPDCALIQSDSRLCSVTGTDTMTCSNGHWLARGSIDICSAAGQQTDSTNIFGCYNGGWTGPGNFPPGSYGGGVAGQPCYLEGQQSFTACPNMANCMGGGTYLTCHNNVWQVMHVSVSDDRASQLASALSALQSALSSLMTEFGH